MGINIINKKMKFANLALFGAASANFLQL